MLEIGIGQGALATLIFSPFGYYRGYEPDSRSYEVARNRLSMFKTVEIFNSLLPEKPDRKFDVLAAFEVLEHLSDDLQELKYWTQWLKPGGLGLFSAPAHPEKYGPLDGSVGHLRRYSRLDIIRLLVEAGFRDIKVTAYGFPLMMLIHWIRNKLVRFDDSLSFAERTASSGRMLQSTGFGGALVSLSIQPFCLLQRPFRKFDWGIGWVASGRYVKAGSNRTTQPIDYSRPEYL